MRLNSLLGSHISPIMHYTITTHYQVNTYHGKQALVSPCKNPAANRMPHATTLHSATNASSVFNLAGAVSRRMSFAGRKRRSRSADMLLLFCLVEDPPGGIFTPWSSQPACMHMHMLSDGYAIAGCGSIAELLQTFTLLLWRYTPALNLQEAQAPVQKQQQQDQANQHKQRSRSGMQQERPGASSSSSSMDGGRGRLSAAESADAERQVATQNVPVRPCVCALHTYAIHHSSLHAGMHAICPPNPVCACIHTDMYKHMFTRTCVPCVLLNRRRGVAGCGA